MSTYNDVLQMIEREVRDRRAWPVNASGNKLTDQLRYTMAALLAVAKDLPLQPLSLFMQREVLSFTEEGGYFIAGLPGFEGMNGTLAADDPDASARLVPDATLFTVRPDFGIDGFVLNGSKYALRMSSTLETVQHAGSSFLHTGSMLFHVDPERAVLYTTTKPASAFIDFVPMPKTPALDALAATPFPLPAPYDEQVAQLAASHVKSVLTGDRGEAAVHAMLSEVYGVKQVVEGGES